MTITHFAGVNTAALASATEGSEILVSYADIIRRPGVWTREILPRILDCAYPRVILDSGAFTVISAGITIDVHEYGRFVAEYGQLFDVVFNLDDIAGDLATTHGNQEILEGYAPEGVDIAPVFHQGESWELLDDYVAKHELIGVGFARRPGGKLVGGCQEFLDEFFARLDGRAQVHGLAMTRWARKGYRFFSVDSTTWISEACSLRRSGQDSKAGGVWGVIGEAIHELARIDTLRLAVRSYRHQGSERWCKHAAGQAATVLARYGEAEFFAALGVAHAEAS